MKYLPFEDFEIHTDLPSDEIFYRLRAAVETEETWFILLLLGNKSYFGKVGRSNFKISRVTWWNHNVTPVVSGKIQSEDLGCRIRIRMRMPWFSFLFSLFWLGAVWYLYFGGIANLIIQKIQTGIWQIESPWLLLLGIGMFAFGYLIFVGSFKSEVRRVKDYLMRLSETDGENIVYRDQFLGFTESQIIKLLFLLTLVISLGWIVFSLLR